MLRGKSFILQPLLTILTYFWLSSRPSLFIGICVSLWGLTSAMTGVSNYHATWLTDLWLRWIARPKFRWNNDLSSFHRVTGGCILPWLYVPPLKMVHEKSIPALVHPSHCYPLTSPKELAFRSAILYGGLLISNAFGSVGTFIADSSCVYIFCLVIGRGDPFWARGKEVYTWMEVVRDMLFVISHACIDRFQGCFSSKWVRLVRYNQVTQVPSTGSNHNLHRIFGDVSTVPSLSLDEGPNPSLFLGGHYLIMCDTSLYPISRFCYSWNPLACQYALVIICRETSGSSTACWRRRWGWPR